MIRIFIYKHPQCPHSLSIRQESAVPGSEMNNQDHILESLETIFGVKILFYVDPGSEIIFHSGFEIWDVKFGSGINILDPQQALAECTTTVRNYTSRYPPIAESTIQQPREQNRASGECSAQSATKLFLRSSELRLPHPFTRRRVGEPQFGRGDTHCGTLGIYIRTLGTIQKPINEDTGAVHVAFV
jgi:hypothetical protein